MAEEELSPQLQDQINRLQQFRVQLEILVQQRQQVELRLKEINQAIEEINKAAEGTPIFKSIGSVLVKTKGKSEITKELKANKETLELRKTTLEKQEGRTKEKLSELQKQVQNSLKISKSE